MSDAGVTKDDFSKFKDNIKSEVGYLVDSGRDSGAKSSYGSDKKVGFALGFVKVLFYILFLFYFIYYIGFRFVGDISDYMIFVFNWIHPESMIFGLFYVNAYMSFVTMYLIFFLIFDMLFMIPWIWFFDTKNETRLKIAKKLQWQGILFLLMIALAGLSTEIQNADLSIKDVSDRELSGLAKFWEEDMCILRTFDVDKCNAEKEARENQVTAVVSSRSSYSLKYGGDSTVTYRTVDSLKARNFILDYEVLSESGNLFLDRVECYIDSDKEDKKKDNLLSEENGFDGKEIEHYKSISLGNYVFCDMSDIESHLDEDFDGSIKLITHLYYSINGSYGYKVPFFNMDKHIADKYGDNFVDYNVAREEQDIRDKVGIVKPVVSIDAIDFSVGSNPDMPYFYGSDYEYDGYFYSLAFEFEKGKGYGSSNKLLSSEIVSYNFPDVIDVKCDGKSCDEVLGEDIKSMDDDKTQFVADMVLKDVGSLSDYKDFEENIEFEIVSNFVYKKTITIKIKDYEDLKKELKAKAEVKNK